MKIGIIGTGNMGRALGHGWTLAGHDVLFGSRDLAKAKSAAAFVPGSAQAGDFDDAATFGEVVLYTVRDVLPSALLRAPESLAGKTLIDCNNSAILGLDIPDQFDRPGVHFSVSVPSLAERIAADVPGARVVKAFNTLSANVIELGPEWLAPHRVSVFLCSDHSRSKSIVKELAEQLGFVGMDSGDLERAQLIESVADFIRYQILAMDLGVFATISVNLLPADATGTHSTTDSRGTG